jgi:hypothetical protein
MAAYREVEASIKCLIGCLDEFGRRLARRWVSRDTE